MDQLFNQSDYQGPVQVASDHAEELPPRYGYGYTEVQLPTARVHIVQCVSSREYKFRPPVSSTTLYPGSEQLIMPAISLIPAIL